MPGFASVTLRTLAPVADPSALVAADEVSHDVITTGPLKRLAALLDYAEVPWAPDILPPLAHWLFFLPDARQSSLRLDGHPNLRGFMPPFAQSRRMWAGSRVTFAATLHIGQAIERRSSIAKVVDKGHMTFVTVRHEISAAGEVAVVEEQDLVYLEAQSSQSSVTSRPLPVPGAATVRSVVADETLLLRFSALTFNAHRIHYDLPYAAGVEHYAGLVVHGPLIATLLLDHALRVDRQAQVKTFEFKARAPIICSERFHLCQSGDSLWAQRDDGTVAMTAQIGFG